MMSTTSVHRCAGRSSRLSGNSSKSWQDERMRRSYNSADFPASRVQAAKRGRRLSVCIPARNEAETIGDIVRRIRTDLVEAVPVVDEILVMDDCSTDGTGTLAAADGAVVCSTDSVLPEYPSHGKGQAMWKAVHAA